MIEDLRRFFEQYPANILQMTGARPSDLPIGLMEGLVDYRDRMLANLTDAQHFRVETDAFWMMSELINEMKRDGLDELFSQVKLPFPTMVLQVPVSNSDQEPFGVVMQVDGKIYTQRFSRRIDGLSPSTCVMISEGMEATAIFTPTRDLFFATGLPVSEGLTDDELNSNRTFLGVAAAIATLLHYDGMLNVEDVSLHPRQLRRQAARSGKTLPDTIISRIVLGKAGRGQVEAMKEDLATEGQAGVPRRTHWVRGHPMRSRSGQLVWRMPHLRGAGPLIKQVRQVTASTPPDLTQSPKTNSGD